MSSLIKVDIAMIRYKLKELMADKQFEDGSRIKMGDVAKATGIHRTTLSKIANIKGYKTSTDVLDRLCEYFDVSLGEIAEYINDDSNDKK